MSNTASFRFNIFARPYAKAILITAVLSFFLHIDFAQGKRMVAIGSSTTVGYGASSPDSCWFGLFSSYYKCRLGVMDSSYNLGVPGCGVYSGMPSSFSTPSNRPVPNNDKNITKAEAILGSIANPADGVIIVNYPSNFYNSYSIDEIMNCLQLIYDSATRVGNRCFITTPQPRCDNAFNNSATKKQLADIKDSIFNRFGDAHTIDFWDGLFDPIDTCVLAEYGASDRIHFNNAGHRIAFERILAKNVFNMPVWYAAATGSLNDLNTWGNNPDGTGAHPSDFAGDNQVFIVANNLHPTIDADWTISGKNVQLVIGDGTQAVLLDIPPAYKLSISSPPFVSNCN